MPKYNLTCNGCGQNFEDLIEMALQHVPDDVNQSTWCGKEGFVVTIQG